jgi:LCP family protein required for cell wall assembly
MLDINHRIFRSLILRCIILLFLTFPTYAQDISKNELHAKSIGTLKPAFKLDKTPMALGISPLVLSTIAKMPNSPKNIALFAVDRRNDEQQGNSDVIIILSIDPETAKLKMTSILRDTYVNIEGVGMDKINAAYLSGGPQLAIKTLNQNFKLDIQDYINVDFFSTAKMIEALGGVTINIKPEKIPYLNNYLREISMLQNISPKFVIRSGSQNLSGNQAVAYTRIRAVGQGDYERTERQRTVLVALFNKLQGAGTGLYPTFINKILPNLETSTSNITLFQVGSNILASKNKNIEQARFPLDKFSKGIRVKNIWYLSADLKANTAALHNFIYKNINPEKL